MICFRCLKKVDRLTTAMSCQTIMTFSSPFSVLYPVNTGRHWLFVVVVLLIIIQMNASNVLFYVKANSLAAISHHNFPSHGHK